MTLARRQRALLCDLFLELGPDAPTLNEGWTTQDLAAHLYIREHKPLAMPGMFVAKFADTTERIQNEAIQKLGFVGLVEKLRTPALLIRPVDAIMNGAEYYIHHEDVLRANDRSQKLTSGDERALRGPLKMFAGRLVKAYGDRVVLDTIDGEELELGRGTRPVHVVGAASEILLFVSGRGEHAKVEFVGEPEAVALLRQSATGI